MIDKKFVFDLVEPYRALVVTCANNSFAHDEFNEAISAAQSLAIAAAHFYEPIDRQVGEQIVGWGKLQDVADTKKHGPLRRSERTVSLSLRYSYEFDGGEHFRFLRREIIAENREHGQFELVNTLKAYIEAIGSRIGFTGTIQPSVPDNPFISEANVVVTPRSSSGTKINIQFYKRNSTGELEPVDPPVVKFAVY